MKIECSSLKAMFLTLLLVLAGQLAFSQNKLVTGTIKDNKGLPLEGASVAVKGGSAATSTDKEGNFRINAPVNATLLITFVGLKNLEVSVRGKTNIRCNGHLWR